jgi:hypothetical protein
MTIYPERRVMPRLIRYDYENDALYLKVKRFERYLGKLLSKDTGVTKNQKLAAVVAKGKWIYTKRV